MKLPDEPIGRNEDSPADGIAGERSVQSAAETPLRVQLMHRTCYAYERAVWLSPHEIRLRPTAHARTPTFDYVLALAPAEHKLKWQHDPYGNWVARVVFGAATPQLVIDVTLDAILVPHNPFDFYVADNAWNFPFAYTPEERHALQPYLQREEGGSRLLAWMERMRRRLLGAPIDTIEFLVAVNHWVSEEVRYVRRDEPGILSCEQTLEAGSGSCRDSAWLLAQVLRHADIATRFVSGYLVQLGAADARLPAGHEPDALALHAWCEAFIPGAGWIGLDATSGLLTGEGHIPLACAALPASAAPVTGSVQSARSTLSATMHVARLGTAPV
jgi:transglutaminase-like putative cysteine protease